MLIKEDCISPPAAAAGAVWAKAEDMNTKNSTNGTNKKFGFTAVARVNAPQPCADSLSL
jgi:hypothetical protein